MEKKRSGYASELPSTDQDLGSGKTSIRCLVIGKDTTTSLLSSRNSQDPTGKHWITIVSIRSTKIITFSIGTYTRSTRQVLRWRGYYDESCFWSTSASDSLMNRLILPHRGHCLWVWSEHDHLGRADAYVNVLQTKDWQENSQTRTRHTSWP